VKATLTGVNEMIAKIRAFKKNFPQAVADALKAEMEIEVKECKKRAPVYTGPLGPSYPVPGVLRDSIHLEGPVIEGTNISAMIVAGGEAGAYAIPQHENLEWFHKQGQAKYIESVIFESRDHIAARVAARIDISKLG
jgi:hypothetical protein